MDATLHRLDSLARSFQIKLVSGPGQPIIDLTVSAGSAVSLIPKKRKGPKIDIEKEREGMYDIVVAMLKEAQRLAEDEVLAGKSEARMSAMLIASNLTRTGEAVLQGYERGYLKPLVDELVSIIEQLKEQLREANTERSKSASTSERE